ncbi:glycosyltransferase family 2 protein [Cupriavidus metallidurans]|uniref:glycosyltransferase family 2 protein n=1 Tax=Cupriavidus metallidurans TaxID=119219 RepID=UPI001CCAF0C7|nr:glycosyltransferase family 2 protein [Cupriavidus metallidurans]UBM12561.1 glycosyltransferase family 2 protein [Cupriavidus metallidurans]
MISVCIATYNGEAYIQEQLDSILTQLGEGDEIVVCDDQSSDRTLDIIDGYHDARIRTHRNEKRLGHVRNFEKALSLSKGDYVFLSDQDDIWLPGRVQIMMSKFEEDAAVDLVASNFDLIDASGVHLGEFRNLGEAKKSRFGQAFAIFAGRAPYFGCTLLLRRSLLNNCLPIPSGVESHDIWIALIASLVGKVVNLPGPTLLHRVHGKNVTKKRRALVVIFRTRLLFLSALVQRMFSLKFKTV